MTRHAEVAASAVVKGAIPVLAALAQGIGDRQVRNMGTIGGSIAQQRSGGRLARRRVLALGATVQTNKRTIAADDFFKGMYETALARRRDHHGGELSGAEEGRLRQVPESGVALRAGRRVRRADRQRRPRRGHRRRAVRAFRSKPLEDALAKSFTADAAKAVKIDAKGLNGDLHASPEYRAHLIAVLAARAVAAAG